MADFYVLSDDVLIRSRLICKSIYYSQLERGKKRDFRERTYLNAAWVAEAAARELIAGLKPDLPAISFLARQSIFSCFCLAASL